MMYFSFPINKGYPSDVLIHETCHLIQLIVNNYNVISDRQTGKLSDQPVTNRLIGQIEDVAVEKSSFSLLNCDLSLSIAKVWARQELVCVTMRQF